MKKRSVRKQQDGRHASLSEGKPSQEPYATLDDFLKKIVKARTPADSMKQFRDFAEWYAPQMCKPRLSENRKELEMPLDPTYTAEQLLKDLKKVGFKSEISWNRFKEQYQHWWKHQKSLKRASAGKESQAAQRKRRQES